MSTCARVLSPAVLSELRRLRPKSANGRAAAIAGVRRNLFGSAGAAAKALADLELNRATDEKCKRWGFDFRSETPLPGRHRFEWRPVGSNPMKPAIEDSRCPTPMEVETQPTPNKEKRKVQTRITDFMKPRKRSATGGAPMPAKIARPNPTSASIAADHRTAS